MALKMIGTFQVYDRSLIFIGVTARTFLCGTQMMAVDAFGVVLLDMCPVIESDLRQAMTGLFNQDYIIDRLIFG
ncbi:MAG: hypothetical protein A2176_01595 [Spirochaetes bacterium RBG_13_51_14]|nr:MAG: hypothetical protein A2176_01595 [Spirochaetes bacterium RBG_13_51_14]